MEVTYRTGRERSRRATMAKSKVELRIASVAPTAQQTWRGGRLRVDNTVIAAPMTAGKGAIRRLSLARPRRVRFLPLPPLLLLLARKHALKRQIHASVFGAENNNKTEQKLFAATEKQL